MVDLEGLMEIGVVPGRRIVISEEDVGILKGTASTERMLEIEVTRLNRGLPSWRCSKSDITGAHHWVNMPGIERGNVFVCMHCLEVSDKFHPHFGGKWKDGVH